MSSKLPEGKQFLDVSDYARPFALALVKILMPTKIGAYTLTTLFLITGITASLLIYYNFILPLASVLILLKSMLDAADGEIARQRNQPSIVGRYYDSVSDFIVNVFLFFSIGHITGTGTWKIIIALLLFHLQGSVYNYYYLVKRYQVKGDRTSRILEFKTPAPFPRDNPVLLKFMHLVYITIYGWQDLLIFSFDKKAMNTKELPDWFLTLVSFLGLGFQLLVIAFLLLIGKHGSTVFIFTYPFTVYAIFIIIIRKIFVR